MYYISVCKKTTYWKTAGHKFQIVPFIKCKLRQWKIWEQLVTWVTLYITTVCCGSERPPVWTSEMSPQHLMYASVASKHLAHVSASVCGIMSLFLGMLWRAGFVILHCLATLIQIYSHTKRLSLDSTSGKSSCGGHLCVMRSFYGLLQPFCSVLRFSGNYGFFAFLLVRPLADSPPAFSPLGLFAPCARLICPLACSTSGSFAPWLIRPSPLYVLVITEACVSIYRKATSKCSVTSLIKSSINVIPDKLNYKWSQFTKSVIFGFIAEAMCQRQACFEMNHYGYTWV